MHETPPLSNFYHIDFFSIFNWLALKSVTMDDDHPRIFYSCMYLKTFSTFLLLAGASHLNSWRFTIVDLRIIVPWTLSAWFMVVKLSRDCDLLLNVSNSCQIQLSLYCMHETRKVDGKSFNFLLLSSAIYHISNKGVLLLLKFVVLFNLVNAWRDFAHPHERAVKPRLTHLLVFTYEKRKKEGPKIDWLS